MDVLETLRRLEMKLEGELRNVPAYQHLKAIRQAIAHIAEAEIARPAGESIQAAKPRRQDGKDRRAALDAIFEYLADRTDPVRTKILVEHLGTLGIRLNGSAVSNLSAALGTDDRFESVDRKGWRRVNPKEEDREPAEPPGAGSEGDVGERSSGSL